MCTPQCDSSYGSDFNYLQNLTSISPSNTIYKRLQRADNLVCVRNFLSSIAHKVK